MRDTSFDCAAVGCEGVTDQRSALCDNCKGKKAKRKVGQCREMEACDGCASHLHGGTAPTGVHQCKQTGPDYLCDEHRRLGALKRIFAERKDTGGVGLEAPAPVVLSLTREGAILLGKLARECRSSAFGGYAIEIHINRDSIELRAPEEPRFKATLNACRLDMREEVSDAA